MTTDAVAGRIYQGRKKNCSMRVMNRVKNVCTKKNLKEKKATDGSGII